ncbi:hypothetical protein YC2023_041791 [Brassica napus]
MTLTDAEPNNFHFSPKHKHYVAHKESVSQLNETLSFVPLGHVSSCRSTNFLFGVLVGIPRREAKLLLYIKISIFLTHLIISSIV